MKNGGLMACGERFLCGVARVVGGSQVEVTKVEVANDVTASGCGWGLCSNVTFWRAVPWFPGLAQEMLWLSSVSV